MAKKVKLKPIKLAVHETPANLRRWCIEQAIRWPWDAGRDYGMATGGFPPPGRSPSEPDILARATKILAWVNAPAA